MSEIIKGRIELLRKKMNEAGISAVIIPQTDAHQSEYLAEHWQVRQWFSGFTGSAGSLVVTADEALLWTDSRYFLQAAQQLEGSGIELMKDGLPATPAIEQWLCKHLAADSTLGVDGMVFSVADITRLHAAFDPAGIHIDTNFSPADDLWSGRPTLPNDPLYVHDVKYAGESATSKINRILETAAEKGANSMFISALDEIAWILNVRSSDVDCNPVATAFLFLSADRNVLFINTEKVDEKTQAYLNSINVDLSPYDSVARYLALLPGDARVFIEPARTAYTLATVIGKHAIEGTSLIALPKAMKNEKQIEGTRQAMARDGVALVKLFMEVERRMASGEKLTELDMAELGTQFRSEGALYVDNSFEMIAGYGPHGAIVHYSATPETSSVIEPHGLLLVDSGAQYLDGTTDITRTVALGTPTAQEKEDFTLVMKGHIALATAVFPEGTRGDQLDALARMPLWKHGLTYLHGTGHGVGHFLNVHEGPQSVRLNHVPVALRPGMITSDEPGLYRAGVHGIRCENLVLCVPSPLSNEEFGNFYAFEPLTVFPFDLRLFDLTLMSDDEISWVNNYHTHVREVLLPLLENENQRQWLTAKTAPLCR
ncbi:MAG: aminopeptidase P family protein [Bacteroides sp.]|nr:aminopeptidase P family protein [Bacteroides sp.]MCM1379502.1 aminopeptidase P family protein [Bacteroides sp.]MCM1445895.1 aminopeptidase P family protein [Prevotella sp.]